MCFMGAKTIEKMQLSLEMLPEERKEVVKIHPDFTFLLPFRLSPILPIAPTLLETS